MQMAMMVTAGSASVQIVRSTRWYVTSGSVMETTNTALTMPVAPALVGVSKRTVVIGR